MLYARCDVCDKEEIVGRPSDFEEFVHLSDEDQVDYPPDYDPEDPDTELIDPLIVTIKMSVTSTPFKDGKSFDHICTKCAVKIIKDKAQDLKHGSGD